jgi:cytoskeletal protein RodZ
VTGLLGFLATSAILTIIGAAIRGLLRPILWGLAITAGLLALNQAVRSTTTLGDNTPQTVSTPPSPTEQSPRSDVPFAREGLQDAAEDLESTIERAFPRETVSPTPSPSDERITQEQPQQQQQQQQQQPTPRQTISPAPAQSPNSIQGLW